NIRVIDQLVIVNLRHEAREKMPAVLNGIEWQTCLRRILFLNANESAATIAELENGKLPLATVEVFKGQNAYRFLLETICGLHSPIVGETAVKGTFKAFPAKGQFTENPWGMVFRRSATRFKVYGKQHRPGALQGKRRQV